MAGRDLDTVAGETKGVLLAVASLDDGGAAFSAMGEGERERCSEAWAALGRLDEAVRDRRLESWRRELATGLPSGLERLHPSWIADALAGEPPHLLALLHDALPAWFGSTVEKVLGRPSEPDRGRAGESVHALAVTADHRPCPGHDLARMAFGHLAPLCESDGGPLAATLCALTFEDLTDEVARLGARTVARSLAGSEAAVRARAMAVTGQPWATVMAQVFGEAVSQPVSHAEREAAARHVAASVAVVAHTPAERLLHIGVATLAADLAAEHPGSRFRVAGRLASRLGRHLLEC